MTPDERQRDTALDVGRSFIVQAPAGSGKTELLIQRYLALLGRVDVPEQVLAITFTRKAAAEMRQRVVAALTEAEEGVEPEPLHRRKTFTLATAVLMRSSRFEWALDMQPQRLRIETLDALNAWLAQHLSVIAGGVAGAILLDDAVGCYEVAVRRTFTTLGDGSRLAHALTNLLDATDNNATRLERMLADLLPMRDQWLPYLAARSDEELRSALESALRRLVDETFQELLQRLPPGFVEELLPLLRDVARETTDPTVATRAADWCSMESSRRFELASLEAWRAVPELLLTKSGSRWRKGWAAAGLVGANRAALRKRLKELVATHQHDESLRAALQSIRELPETTYSAAEWSLVAGLRTALRHLTAELKVVFGERHCVDFVELALSAQQALGRVDEPSELLLALDRRLQHILVDEFQDTSHTQLRLLRLLTSGWEPDDGRTLFLVGDPMQSIYRFRHADMSLFLKTQAGGIGNVRLTPLVLDSNFRSAPGLVDWVNVAFARIFPPVDDMGSGASRFHACQSTRSRHGEQAVCWHALRGSSPTAEVERVTAILHGEIQARPNGSTVVLVRSRSHLAGLQEQLRARGVVAHAVELEAPNQQQVVQDLIGLTRALTHLRDRIAWLGVLRAPWCGLRWQDLLVLSHASQERAIWSSMQDDRVLERLTPDGRERLALARSALSSALERRALQPLERWVEDTWIALGGAQCLEEDGEQRSAERFFSTLAALTLRGDLDDPAWLEQSFTEPYGQGDPPRESGVEIMTIHRAKGLEFDTVILLGLGRRPRPDEPRGLYWIERTAADGSEDLLLAPLSVSGHGTTRLAGSIRRADAIRNRAESQRLLYVAATRARDRLHLVAQLREDKSGPPAGSLLEHLWFDAADHFNTTSPKSESVPQPAYLMPKLRRVRTIRNPARPERDGGSASPRPEFLWVSHAAVQVGTIVHAALHEIAVHGIDTWTRESIDARRSRFRDELIVLGVDDSDIEHSVQRIVDALCGVLDDERGRWLLMGHTQAVSELPITIRVADGFEHLRIDRTFIDETGLRWIIDFKTSYHEGGARDAFLDSEVERYRAQLDGYAAALAEIDNRPMKVGLYFPLLQAFRCWPVATSRVSG